MTKPTDIPRRQRLEMYRVGRHETKDFGVIVHHATGTALVRRGFAAEANRREFAREGGLCIRLTDKGRAWVNE